MPADTRYLENPYASSTASAPTPRELSNSDLDVLLTRIDRHVHYSRPDVYVGAAGVALLYLHLGNHARALDIAENALASGNGVRSGSSFVCGDVGLLAVAAVAYYRNDPRDPKLKAALKRIEKGFEYVLLENASNELLYGRAGYLYATQFLRKNIPLDSLGSRLPKFAKQTVDRILSSGLRSASPRGPPLFWLWHGKAYLGAAHGFAGILTTVLQEHHVFGTPISAEHLQAIKATIDWLVTLQTEDGNMPSSLESGHANLVQFCHGAPGLVMLLTEAMRTFGEKRKDWLGIAEKAGLCVWTKGVLMKGVGLCHGISGNAYTFAALYAATGDNRWLGYRNVFASLALDLLKQGDQLSMPDHPYSLFEGIGGLAWLVVDLLKGRVGGFPAFSDMAQDYSSLE